MLSDPRLPDLLARLRPAVRPERFVFIGLDYRERHLVLRLAGGVTAPFAQLTIEPDGVTLLLPESEWRPIAPAFPRARVLRPMRVITFAEDLPDDLTGFLAAITAALAAANVPLLAVCGFTKDHVVVREQYLDAALTALARLASNG
jgi:hypothetical protein